MKMYPLGDILHRQARFASVKAEEMTLRLGDTVKFLDFTGLAQVVAKHKRAARLVAALKARSDLGSIKRSISQAAEETGVKLEKVGRKLVPKAGDEIGCLELLDHRRYTTALKAGPKPAFVVMQCTFVRLFSRTPQAGAVKLPVLFVVPCHSGVRSLLASDRARRTPSASRSLA